MQIVSTAILSTKHKLTDKASKDILAHLYPLSKWQQSSDTSTLHDMHLRPELLVIRTDNILIIDFDDDIAFHRALTYNELLPAPQQCSYIVKSSRQGGHMYYAYTDDIKEQLPLPALHTKQSLIDLLHGKGHNAIAPSQGDTSKSILHSTLASDEEVLLDSTKQTHLNAYNILIHTLVTNMVNDAVPPSAKAINYLASSQYDSRHSDDAVDFVQAYVATPQMVTNKGFNEYYNIPNPIPAGQSNEMYKKLSTRLASDETINQDLYLAAMKKFNEFHQRKTLAELSSQHTDRMIKNTNGLWRYDKDKQTATYTATHKIYKTKASVFYDLDTGEYLLTYKNGKAESRLHKYKSRTAYIDAAEKIVATSRQAITQSTAKIRALNLISDYKKKEGFDEPNNTYNSAYINSYLKAFYGAKSTSYSEERLNKFLKLLKYMWGENYEYILDTTKYRYTKFQFSPVITYFNGSEGSGKDVSIDILTRGFSMPPQNLSFALMSDKHSNWQTSDNAIFSEIGSWRGYEISSTIAEMKSISGSNGKVTFRGMQQTALVKNTLIKIWVTGNEWTKLHTDPTAQRRLHVVYMPRPLSVEQGGNYTQNDLQELLSDQCLNDFYHWLGNIYEYSPNFTIDKYMSAASQQHTEAYRLYIQSTQGISDIVTELLWTQKYDDTIKAIGKYGITLSDVDYKYSRAGNIHITITSLKDALSAGGAKPLVLKIVDRLSAEKEDSKRLKFDSGLHKYITIYNCPKQSVEAVDINSEEGDGL